MVEYELKSEDLKTKCGWSPFTGQTLTGKVDKVVLRGEVVYENGQIIAVPGSGRILP